MARSVARLHLLPQGGDFADYRDEIFEFCQRSGIIGVGWHAGPPAHDPFTWEHYRAQQNRTDLSSVQGLHDLSKGDLVWVRSPTASYFIAEVRGPWEYRYTPLHRAMDIVNIRRVEYFCVASADVSMDLENAFIPPIAFQYVRNQNLIDHTIAVWEQLF